MQVRTSASLSTRSHASTIVESISVESALRASGRFSVKIKVCPRCSMMASGPFSALFTSLTEQLPSSVDATDLNENVTRSSLGLVAPNIDDLAEHAIEAVPGLLTLSCG